jgi:hypothetical protein
MFRCEDCDKSFVTIVGLNGHKRIHGPSQGKIRKIFCSCIFTRKVTPYQDLAKYQSNLVNCKECNKLFSGKIFCSQSCAATFNNTIKPKRKKKIKPPKIVKIPLTYKEIKAKKVEAVQAYRSRKYNATPSNANRKLIVEIYKHCPAGYEVDHIIALVEGGLHHEENLQYLPAAVNRKKNRHQDYDRSTVIRWQDIVHYAPR